MTWETDLKKMQGADINRLVVCFDDGTWCPYLKERWPFALCTGWLELPEITNTKEIIK